MIAMKKGIASAGGYRKYKTYTRLINSWTWQQLRHRKFVNNPICEMCAKEGRVTPTEEVHHIKPVESGRDDAEMRKLAYDYDNLQSLCKACHARVHAKEKKPMKENSKDFFAKYM